MMDIVEITVGVFALAIVASLLWAAWRSRHKIVGVVMALWRARITVALIAANCIVIIFGVDMTENMVRNKAPDITSGVLLILVPLFLIHILALRTPSRQ